MGKEFHFFPKNFLEHYKVKKNFEAKIKNSIPTCFCTIQLRVECRKLHRDILKTVGDSFSLKRELQKNKLEISTVKFFLKTP